MKKKKKITIEQQKKLEGALFILPWLIGFILFMAYPIFNSLYMTFHDVKLRATGLRYEYTAFENFEYALFTNPEFQDNLLLNFKETLVIIPVIVIFAFMIANLINNRFAGKAFFRAMFFLPVMITTGYLMDQLFTMEVGNMTFLVNEQMQYFLMDTLGKKWAQPILNVINKFVLILWYSGVQIVIFIAGLQSISKSIYDAASIDGATVWESFWKITLPAMVPFILLNTIYTIVDLFTLPWNPIILMIEEHYTNARTGPGLASAMSWIYFATILVLIIPVFLLLRKRTGRKRKKKKTYLGGVPNA